MMRRYSQTQISDQSESSFYDHRRESCGDSFRHDSCRRFRDSERSTPAATLPTDNPVSEYSQSTPKPTNAPETTPIRCTSKPTHTPETTPSKSTKTSLIPSNNVDNKIRGIVITTSMHK